MYQSYVDSNVKTQTATSNMLCEAELGFPAGIELECEFITGRNIDTLTVKFPADALQNTEVGAGPLSLVVKGIRGPPTTSAVSGFIFSTGVINELGILDVLDSSTAPIFLKVTSPDPVLSSNMVVSADFQSIFKLSTLTFKVLTVNPFEKFSSI